MKRSSLKGLSTTVHHGFAPELMDDVFKKTNVMYKFRKNWTFETRKIKSVYYGSVKISFLGPKIWEILPSNIKNSENIFKSTIKSWKPENFLPSNIKNSENIFKSTIKSSKPENCPCRFCRLYIAEIGFYYNLFY